MPRNPLIPQRPSKVEIVELRKSAGILDDHAIRKTIATKEGTITKVPTDDYEIVNKAYCDGNLDLIYLGKIQGTTVSISETSIGTVTIPAGTFAADDWIYMVLHTVTTGLAPSATLRITCNSTNSDSILAIAGASSGNWNGIINTHQRFNDTQYVVTAIRGLRGATANNVQTATDFNVNDWITTGFVINLLAAGDDGASNHVDHHLCLKVYKVRAS